MCIHSAIKLDYETSLVSVVGDYSKSGRVVSLAEVIEKKFGQIPTASTVVRHDAYKEFVDFIVSQPELAVGDVFLHFFGALRGGALSVDQPMSCYRLHTEGSFGDRYKKSGSLRYKHLVTRVESYLVLDKATGFMVSSSLKKSSRKFVFSFLKNPKNTYSNRLRVLSKYGYLLDAKEKSLIYPLTAIPFLLNVAHPAIKFIKATGTKLSSR